MEIVEQQLLLISQRLESLLSEKDLLESINDIRELDSWRQKCLKKDFE